MASRIHGDVYVRFRGRYAETCRRKAVRRCIPSLQTNLREARPELWEQLEVENGKRIENGEHFSFAPVDTMIRDNLWICPIKPRHQDEAYYSITRNEIIVPEKEQFQSGEAFYGTLFHEMVHSTGAEGVLDRLQPTSFGSKEYAREELVAELGSALIAQRYGMTKHIKEDSCAYLKGWLDELKESPQFIKTTLLDVKRASSIVTQKVDKIAQELEQNVTEEQENKHSTKERIFYASVAYLQSTDDTTQLDELKDKGDYKGLLALAKEYYDGNGINEYIVSFLGFAPADDPEVIVLLGYDWPQPSAPGQNTTKDGTYISGGNMAAPMAGELIANILDYLGYQKSGNTVNENGVTIPNVVGQTPDEARAALNALGLNVRTSGEGSVVTDQMPTAGSTVPKGSSTVLYLGEEKPKETVAMPDLSGMTYDEAKKALEDVGLYLNATGSGTSGTVFEHLVLPGTPVELGATVEVKFAENTEPDNGLSSANGDWAEDPEQKDQTQTQTGN